MTTAAFDPTFDFEGALESPVFDTPARAAARPAARWCAWTTERRAARDYRRQERALRRLTGAERTDALAAARRA
jgi:hypothetical protein